MEKENEIREELVIRLNEIGADETLILFNDYDGGSLDNQINGIIGEWTNEEFKDFIEFAEQRNKNISVIKNL